MSKTCQGRLSLIQRTTDFKLFKVCQSEKLTDVFCCKLNQNMSKTKQVTLRVKKRLQKEIQKMIDRTFFLFQPCLQGVYSTNPPGGWYVNRNMPSEPIVTKHS